jgi:hypothetical protein
VRPQVLKLKTWSAACTQCGHTLASRHPRQLSQAGGCAGGHLGPRAQALAATLRHGHGLSLDKTARVLRELGGLSITPVQQKCYAHPLRALKIAAVDCSSDQWVSLVRQLLLQAMELHKVQGTLNKRQRAARRRGLQVAALALLEEPRADPAEERLRLRLYKQRDHLFTFLQHPGVDPTNNLAERELRPAVIARKLSCGHRTPHGAHTWATLASLVRTCARRGQAFPSFALPALLLNPLTPQQG